MDKFIRNSIITFIIIVIMFITLGISVGKYLLNKDNDEFKIKMSSFSVNPNYTINFVPQLFLDKEIKSGKFKNIISITEDPCGPIYKSCPNYVMIISDNR